MENRQRQRKPNSVQVLIGCNNIETLKKIAVSNFRELQRGPQKSESYGLCIISREELLDHSKKKIIGTFKYYEPRPLELTDEFIKLNCCPNCYHSKHYKPPNLGQCGPGQWPNYAATMKKVEYIGFPFEELNVTSSKSDFENLFNTAPNYSWSETELPFGDRSLFVLNQLSNETFSHQFYLCIVEGCNFTLHKVKHLNNKVTGHWHYPNINLVQGGIEPNETPKAAAIREVNEEAGVVSNNDFNDLGMFVMYKHDNDKNPKYIQVFSLSLDIEKENNNDNSEDGDNGDDGLEGLSSKLASLTVDDHKEELHPRYTPCFPYYLTRGCRNGEKCSFRHI